jgi:hypothetical protein
MRSVTRSVWKAYVGIGAVLAAPAFLSYLVGWPFALLHASQLGAPLLVAIGIVVFYELVGYFSCLLLIVMWPYSLYLLATGGYPSFWAFLFPAFYLMPSVVK